jgi:hypothetical protein
MPFQPGDDMPFTFDAGPAVHPDGSAMKHRQQYDDWLQSKHADVGVMCWDCHDPIGTTGCTIVLSYGRRAPICA